MLTMEQVAGWVGKRFVPLGRVLYLAVPLVLDDSTLTIAGGTVSVTRGWHRIETEGAAATDDLTTINGGTDGQLLLLSAMDASHDVVVKHSTGNILLQASSDFTMSNRHQPKLFVYNGVTSFWMDI